MSHEWEVTSVSERSHTADMPSGRFLRLSGSYHTRFPHWIPAILRVFKILFVQVAFISGKMRNAADHSYILGSTYVSWAHHSCRITWITCDWLRVLTGAHARWRKRQLSFQGERKPLWRRGSLELQDKIVRNDWSQGTYGPHNGYTFMITKWISSPGVQIRSPPRGAECKRHWVRRSVRESCTQIMKNISAWYCWLQASNESILKLGKQEWIPGAYRSSVR